MNSNLRIAALIALALGASTAEAAKFYKWTDEQGATHYTAEPPPPGAKSSEVRVQAKPGAARPATPATPAAAAAPGKAKADDKAKTKGQEQKAEASKGPEQYAEKCKGLRANLQAMEDHGRVKEMTASGEARVLSDDEKNARLDETRREIKAFCE